METLSESSVYDTPDFSLDNEMEDLKIDDLSDEDQDISLDIEELSLDDDMENLQLDDFDTDSLELDDDDLSFDDSLEEEIPVSDSLVPEPAEGVEGDIDSDSDDLGFEDLVGITETDELSDELSETESSNIDMSVEEEEELSFDDSDDLSLGEELDLSATDDFDFEDSSDLSSDDTDDFDLSGEDLDFEDDLSENEELSLDDSDAGEMDLDEFEISDEGFDEDLEIDEFDLGDLGQDFGVLEDDISSIPETEISLDDSSDIEEDLEEEEFEIDEKSFEKVKINLQNLPRNLKLIIEEEIGEKGLKGPSLEKLIDALADGKSPNEIAAITSKIIGKKIKIPTNYAKRTGSDFEEEKGSFQYALLHKIVPLLKIFLISSVIITAISFSVYSFIYKPVHAYILYNRGYEQLEESNYTRSAELFDKAFEKYKMKKQFYRFAEGYIDSKQFEFARNQYNNLLKNYPYDKKGTIDYATMEFEKLADYEHSSELLKEFLIESDKHKRDYDALLLLGDIYLEWGFEDYDRYDDARLAYAKIMSTYGIENIILFRMLRFFIRTDNAKEVDILKERFQADKEAKIDPEAYAELAGYQIDRKDISDVQELLFRAKDVEEGLPEIHYQLARLFNITGEGDEEDKALERTLNNLKNKKPLNRRNLEVNIDTLRRKGERFYTKKEYLQAEEVYQEGIDLLEKSRERNILRGEGQDYGRLYADLGHIYYYISENPDIALSQYEKAEAEGFYSLEIYYNKGYIKYRTENFREALLEFYNSAV
ncbi:MAG: hypothetical protein KAH95_15455, partial [Spirochaetales bacterium]|nr:hypothetical protein [Spirochaetales bacterium]